MSFIRYKTKGDKTYAYEITSYYDKDKKTPRQKSKYLGVVNNGNIERTRASSSPHMTFDYGNIAIALKIAEEVKLKQTLIEVYGEHTTNIILALATNRIIQETSLSNFRYWYENTYLTSLTPIENPSSQMLSRFLDQLGEEQIKQATFFKNWCGQVSSKSSIAYDLTSISSSSELIDMLEYGYSRDKDYLPQLNLGYVASLDVSLPLYFKKFPGSINDVVTIRNLLSDLHSFGVDRIRLILDRGFYSQNNIKEMIEGGMDFVMAMPFHVKMAQKIIAQNNLKSDSPDRAVSYHGKIIYVGSGEAEINSKKVKYYHIFDEERKSREINTFYGHLIKIESLLDGKIVNRYENINEILNDTAGKYSGYFTVKRIDSTIVLKRRSKAISRITNRMGKTILIFTDDIDWETALSHYRNKDRIEKMFKALKNDLGASPIRVHKETTLDGSLLISFVALVIYSDLIRRMRESNLVKEYSMEGIFLELAKIKKIRLLDGSEITSEITKKCRSIVQRLGLKDIVPT